VKHPALPLTDRGTIGALMAFQQAVSLHDQGRLWEAERLFEIVLKTDQRHFGAIYRLGLIRLRQGRFDDAARLFRRAAKIDKTSADAQLHLGVALTGLGRFDDAILCSEKALAIKPHFAEAYNNFGYTLEVLGRTEEAISQYEQALTIVPAYAEARNNLGNALQKLNQFDAAIAQYEKALAIRPNYAEAYNNLGNVLGTLRRHEAAIANYQKALAIRPRYVDAHHSLGNTLGAMGRHEEALAHYEQALTIDPNNVEIHNTLGNLLFVLGRVEEAVPHCEKALVIQPDHVGAHNNLGIALRALGRLDAAIHAFERAIALAPRATSGYLNLATSRRFTAQDPQFVAMQELARDAASLDVGSQINLHFALGKVFDDMGDPQQSARHLLLGNFLKRQQTAYDQAKTLERLERIRMVFTARLMREKHGLGDPSSIPVFIIGMPRSGTTLVEQILASHPKVFGAEELPEMAKLAAGIRGRDGIPFPEAAAAISSEQLLELGRAYLRAIRQKAPTAERVTDKLPGNFTRAGLIHLALPNSCIIHIRRDPLDTALSCFSTLFSNGQLEFTYDLTELGNYIRAYQVLMEHWRKVLPEGRILEVQYEGLVENLEQQARRIVAHCGLEWDDACLNFHNTQRFVRTASVTQVRQPIYRSSVGRCRAYQDLLQPVVQALRGS
jgi:tetratricopeptide (TPR) repeat protein